MKTQSDSLKRSRGQVTLDEFLGDVVEVGVAVVSATRNAQTPANEIARTERQRENFMPGCRRGASLADGLAVAKNFRMYDHRYLTS